MLFAPFMYGGTGGFLRLNSMFLRQGKKNVGFVSSSRMDDLLEAIKYFKAIKAGGRASDFGAAVSKVRIARTPGPRDLACVADHCTNNAMDIIYLVEGDIVRHGRKHEKNFYERGKEKPESDN